MWEQIPNNKVVGALWENTADGVNFANVLPGLFQELGYTLSDPGLYPVGTEDYTAIINQFKKDGVEIVCGMASPPRLLELLEAGRAAGLQAANLHRGRKPCCSPTGSTPWATWATA